jgi:hypothetical protein
MSKQEQRIIRKKCLIVTTERGVSEVREVEGTLTIGPRNSRKTTPQDIAEMHQRRRDRVEKYLAEKEAKLRANRNRKSA